MNFLRAGKRFQFSTKQGDKQAAREIEAAFRTNLSRGEYGLNPKPLVPTLKQFSQRFIESVKVRSEKRPRTIEYYEEKLRRLLEYDRLARARLDQIDEPLMEQYILLRRQMKMSIASINRELATLRRILRLAYKWKVVESVPHVQLLFGEKPRDFVLNEEQEKRYLEACPQPLKDMAIIMVDGSLRLGDVVSLEWKSVDLGREPHLKLPRGKGKHERFIPLSQRATEMLKARSGNGSPIVFPSPAGTAYLPTSIDHMHTRVRTKAHLPAVFVIHSLRHSALTRLGEASKDPFAVKLVAGHSSIQTSERYVHISNDQVRRAMDQLEKSRKKSRGDSENEESRKAKNKG